MTARSLVVEQNGLAAPLWTRHPKTARLPVAEQFFPPGSIPGSLQNGVYACPLPVWFHRGHHGRTSDYKGLRMPQLLASHRGVGGLSLEATRGWAARGQSERAKKAGRQSF